MCETRVWVSGAPGSRRFCETWEPPPDQVHNDPGTAFLRLQAYVTSNLDFKIRRADHRQGGGGVHKKHETGLSPWHSRFLPVTPCGSRFCQLILQTPRHSSLSQAWPEGGTPQRSTDRANSQNDPSSKHLLSPITNYFFDGFPQPLPSYLLAKLPRHSDFA